MPINQPYNLRFQTVIICQTRYLISRVFGTVCSNQKSSWSSADGEENGQNGEYA